MDPAKAELLGLLAAEGNEYHYSRRYARFLANRGPAGKWYLINYRQQAVEFTNVELALQLRVYQLLVMTYDGQKAAFGSRYRIRIRRKAIVTDLLRHTRLGCLEWRVPPEVMRSNYDHVKGAWCRGFADGEGTIRASEINLPSTNLRGLRQVQQLLKSLEIGSKLRGPYNHRPYLDSFALAVPKRHFLTYARRVGFNHPRKKRILSEILSTTPVDRGS